MAAATGTPSKVARDIRGDLQDAADVAAARNVSFPVIAGSSEQGQVDVAVECRKEAACKDSAAARKKVERQERLLSSKCKNIRSDILSRSRSRTAAARGSDVTGSCHSKPTEDTQLGADPADDSAPATKQVSPPCDPPPSPIALPPPPPPQSTPPPGPPKISATSLQPATEEQADPPAAKPSSTSSPTPRSPLPPPPGTPCRVVGPWAPVSRPCYGATNCNVNTAGGGSEMRATRRISGRNRITSRR